MLHYWAGMKQVKKGVHVCNSIMFICSQMGQSKPVFIAQQHHLLLLQTSMAVGGDVVVLLGRHKTVQEVCAWVRDIMLT